MLPKSVNPASRTARLTTGAETFSEPFPVRTTTRMLNNMHRHSGYVKHGSPDSHSGYATHGSPDSHNNLDTQKRFSTHCKFSALITIFTVCTLITLFTLINPKNTQAQIDYNTQVQTILNQRCAGCHNSNGLSGVRLINYDAVMASQGSQYGRLIVEPEKPDESPLYDKINPNPEKGNQMPSATNPLTADQIETIRQWIEEGALPEAPATSIAQSATIPATPRLGQNYPNPFNPATSIPFALHKPSRVTLTLFDLHGRRISALAEGTMSAGTYELPLSMAGKPSGLYLYRLDVQPLDGSEGTQLHRSLTLLK